MEIRMKALLIIDIQNDYFKGGNCELVNPEIASANAKKLLEKFREKNMPVFHIQHFSIRENATYFLPNTNGVLIHETVKPLENEKVIFKNFPDSFSKTRLLDELKKQNIKELVICGMMTHMCIDTTTRAAFDFGFDCIVAYDSCCTKDLEFNKKKILAQDVHDSFMASLNGIFAKVLNTDEILLNL